MQVEQLTSSRQFMFTSWLANRFRVAMMPQVRFLSLEGPARGSKSVFAIQVFYWKVFNSSEKYHLMSGQSLDTINNNLLNTANVGLLVTHRNVKMVKDKIGGYHLSLIGADGNEKIILLTGYSNESRWKSILGGTLGCVFIDEINIANKTFIDETFSRQLSVDYPFTICTLNGDDPENSCYQEYINFGKIVGKCPQSTLELMSNFQSQYGIRDGYYYMFFPMSSNPTMTAEKLARAMSIYPVGSYYYQTKILGERGIQGDLLFKDYMSEQLLIDCHDNEIVKWLRHYTIGIDIGADVARNVFTLTGWNADFSKAYILKIKSFECCGYNKKTEELDKFLEEILYYFIQDKEHSKYAKFRITPNNLEAIRLDCAEQNYIADLNQHIYDKFGIAVWGSNKMTIKLRIDLMAIGFSTKRIYFDKNEGYLAYNSYERAKKGQEKNVLREDLNEEKNDVMDAVEYSITPHYYQLLNGGNY